MRSTTDILDETAPPVSWPQASLYIINYTLFLLPFHEFFLLLLQGLKACGESAGLLVRVVLVSLIVGLQLGQEFGIVGRAAEPLHGQGTEKEGDEIVVVQPRRVLVEHEEEEQGHEHHHPLHHLHLLCLFARHRFTLLAHGHEAIEQVGGAEEEAEEAEVVAKPPDVEVPGNEAVVGGEVFGPEEALLAEFDGVRHEVEHGNPDGHLYEHG